MTADELRALRHLAEKEAAPCFRSWRERVLALITVAEAAQTVADQHVASFPLPPGHCPTCRQHIHLD